jgi:hypothetical protein
MGCSILRRTANVQLMNKFLKVINEKKNEILSMKLIFSIIGQIIIQIGFQVEGF